MPHPEWGNEEQSVLSRIHTNVLESALLKIAIVGLFLIASGIVLEVNLLEGSIPNSGLWAAILPMWGVALIIVSVSIYVLIWWSHQ